MKLYTIKITEKESLFVDVFAESKGDALKRVMDEHWTGEYENMRRECENAEYDVVFVR